MLDGLGMLYPEGLVGIKPRTLAAIVAPSWV